jgi:hypothetical protein
LPSGRGRLLLSAASTRAIENHPGCMLERAGRTKARRVQLLVEGLPARLTSRPSKPAPRISSVYLRAKTCGSRGRRLCCCAPACSPGEGHGAACSVQRTSIRAGCSPLTVPVASHTDAEKSTDSVPPHPLLSCLGCTLMAVCPRTAACGRAQREGQSAVPRHRNLLAAPGPAPVQTGTRHSNNGAGDDAAAAWASASHGPAHRRCTGMFTHQQPEKQQAPKRCCGHSAARQRPACGIKRHLEAGGMRRDSIVAAAQRQNPGALLLVARQCAMQYWVQRTMRAIS